MLSSGAGHLGMNLPDAIGAIRELEETDDQDTSRHLLAMLGSQSEERKVVGPDSAIAKAV